MRLDHPELGEVAVIEQAHLLIAYPPVAGHPTGGAVDVTLSRDGSDLDMGGSVADFSNLDLIPTASLRVSEAQRKNRLLLRAVMMRQEFAPFDGEWWHFSYGDREWAAYQGAPEALFGPLE